METRGTERRKENTLAGARLHGVTRKYDAPKASRRSTKRPRRLNPEFSSRGLLGGSTRNTLPSSVSLLATSFPARSSSSRRSPSASLCSPDRAALFAKACRTLRERGTTHRASQITPLSKSPDLQASVYTVQRSHHCSLAERLPSFCVLIFRCLGVVESSVRLTPVFSSFVLSRVHSLSSDVHLFLYSFLSSTMRAIIFFSVLAVLHSIRVLSQLSPSDKFLFFFSFSISSYTYICIVFSLYLSSNHFLMTVIRIKSSAKAIHIDREKEREKYKSVNNYFINTTKI